MLLSKAQISQKIRRFVNDKLFFCLIKSIIDSAVFAIKFCHFSTRKVRMESFKF